MSDLLTACRDTSRFRHVCLRWLSGVVILAAASAVAWPLAVRAEMPGSAACVLTAAVGYVLYRVVGANRAGIVLWCLAVLSLSAASWAVPLGEPGVLRALCVPVGLILSLAAVVTFLVVALKDRTRRARNCACCCLAFFTWLSWAIGGIQINAHLRHQEAIRHTTETLVKLHKLAAEIEVFRGRFGRLPNGEKELVALRGEPMPTYYQDYQITYERRDDDHYYLTCSLNDFWGRSWDIFGWVVYYRGPDSSRRIQACLF